MRKAVLILIMVSMAASLWGCETVKGVGRDIEGASSSMQKAISKSR